ncbi:MAG: FprA family A-type flavoprotein [Deltaproteobacteria bacterium]|nr:FprA family A-type flavoprotein [Deltaproteobacteria bacterium]
MQARPLGDGFFWVGAQDPDRRLFDNLIPLPHGTSYNAWVVRGSEGTVLVDAVEPHFGPVLFERLASIGAEPDFVVSNHAEQDHSGTLPEVMARFPRARLLTTPKGRDLLTLHLDLPVDRIRTVEDGETISLGNRTLEFLHAPWVHWPETMLTYVRELGLLLPCDLFGSHLSTDQPWASRSGLVMEDARRYFATIMMPFTAQIRKHLARLEAWPCQVIAPSHGPVWDHPEDILEAYRYWVDGGPRNKVVIAWVSMHGSTQRMVEHLVDRLLARDVDVEAFNLSAADLGRVAAATVDAATLVLGTPTVLGGAHPTALHAAMVLGALKPRIRHVAVIGSYAWGGRSTDQLAGLVSGLKAEVLDPVQVRGIPRSEDLAALDALAETIARRHADLTLTPKENA